MTGWDTTSSNIASVTHIKHKCSCCNKPKVLVTFNNGNTFVAHDDGSFIAWTGEIQ